MASFQANVVLVWVCVAYVVLMIKSTAGQDVTFVRTACNGREIVPATDYAEARNIALKMAVDSTPGFGYNYSGRSRYMYSLAYSHGACNGDILHTDCQRCMRVARRYLIASCDLQTEGWVLLKDCLISFWEFPNS